MAFAGGNVDTLAKFLADTVGRTAPSQALYDSMIFVFTKFRSPISVDNILRQCQEIRNTRKKQKINRENALRRLLSKKGTAKDFQDTEKHFEDLNATIRLMDAVLDGAGRICLSTLNQVGNCGIQRETLNDIISKCTPITQVQLRNIRDSQPTYFFTHGVLMAELASDFMDLVKDWHRGLEMAKDSLDAMGQLSINSTNWVTKKQEVCANIEAKREKVHKELLKARNEKHALETDNSYGTYKVEERRRQHYSNFMSDLFEYIGYEEVWQYGAVLDETFNFEEKDWFDNVQVKSRLGKLKNKDVYDISPNVPRTVCTVKAESVEGRDLRVDIFFCRRNQDLPQNQKRVRELQSSITQLEKDLETNLQQQSSIDKASTAEDLVAFLLKKKAENVAWVTALDSVKQRLAKTAPFLIEGDDEEETMTVCESESLRAFVSTLEVLKEVGILPGKLSTGSQQTIEEFLQHFEKIKNLTKCIEETNKYKAIRQFLPPWSVRTNLRQVTGAHTKKWELQHTLVAEGLRFAAGLGVAAVGLCPQWFTGTRRQNTKREQSETKRIKDMSPFLRESAKEVIQTLTRSSEALTSAQQRICCKWFQILHETFLNSSIDAEREDILDFCAGAHLETLRSCLVALPCEFDRGLDSPLFQLLEKASAHFEKQCIDALKGTKLEDFDVLDRLGKDPTRPAGYEGAQSIVFRAKLRNKPELGDFALKVGFSSHDQSGKLRDHFNQDLFAFARADKPSSPRRVPAHPNLLPILHTFTDAAEGLRNVSESAKQLFELYGDGICLIKNLFMVSLTLPSSLKRHMDDASRESPTHEQHCLVLTKQLLRAIRHLQEHRIVHRDLKPDNVLVTKNSTGICLIDLGEALDCKKEGLEDFKLPFEFTDMANGGAQPYLPPEIQQKAGTDVVLDYAKSDLWSAGLILYEMLAGPNTKPYKGMKPNSGEWWKQEGAIEWHALDERYTLETRQFCKGLLVIDPKERLTVQQAIEQIDTVIKEVIEQSRKPRVAVDDAIAGVVGADDGATATVSATAIGATAAGAGATTAGAGATAASAAVTTGGAGATAAGAGSAAAGAAAADSDAAANCK